MNTEDTSCWPRPQSLPLFFAFFAFSRGYSNYGDQDDERYDQIYEKN